MKIKNKNIEINKMNVDEKEKEYKSETDFAIETVSEMIVQRGYSITETDDDRIIATNAKDEQIVVFTQPVVKFNVDRIKECISILDKMKQKHCIIIYTDRVTAPTKKLVNNSVDIKIEIFTQAELQYNITKHRLVPKHERLPTKEAKEFKKTFGVKFAAILLTDPIARFYNYQRGDVIKITRKSDRGVYITYRIVKG